MGWLIRGSGAPGQDPHLCCFPPARWESLEGDVWECDTCLRIWKFWRAVGWSERGWIESWLIRRRVRRAREDRI